MADQLNVDAITQEQLTPLVEDYTSEQYSAGLNARQNAFKDEVVSLFKAPEILNQADPDVLVGELIKQGNRIGGVDDIVAKASRDILRLKGQSLGDEGLDQVFSEYKIKVPPVDGIKFEGYDSLDDEHEKVDGWAAQAKAAYNLKTKARHPELLAHRDEVFQKIDDTAKGLKRKVGATDSGFVDFVGRLAEGAASVFDSVDLDGVGDFIRKHSATNPEWDSETSSIIGQALGQGVTQLGAFAAVTGATIAAGGPAALGLAIGAVGAGVSNLNATQKEREEKVLQATGSANLAEDVATANSAYVEAGIDTLIDVSLLGAGKLGAGKVAKKLLGSPGRKLVGEGFAESLRRTAGSLDRIKTAAGLAGDVLWNGTKEGATEALQGAISDTSVGSYTNMKDQFDPFDLRNRAADVIGGFAGGAGITLANTYILPKNRLPQEEAPAAANLDERLREAGTAFSAAPDAGTAANAMTDFITTAAIQETDSILAGQEVDIPNLPQVTPEGQNVTKPDAGFAPPTLDRKSIYENARPVLGDMINNPTIQEHFEAGLDFIDNIQSYIPAARPKDSDLEAQKKAEEATATPVTTEPVQTTDAPLQAAESAVTDLTAAPEAPLDAFEEALKKFNVLETVPTTEGGTRTSFSLIDPTAQKAANLESFKQAKATGLLDTTEGSGAGGSIKGGGEALNIDRNTYSVERDASGKPVAFLTESFGNVPGTKQKRRTRDTTVNTPERLAARVQGILDTQKIATENLQARAKFNAVSRTATRYAVPSEVTVQLPETAQTFVNTVISPGKNGGGNIAAQQAESDAYLSDGRAFQDLVDSGLTEDQAGDYLTKVRAFNTPEYKTARINGKLNPKRVVRREILNDLHLDLAKNLLDAQDFTDTVKGTYKPEIAKAVLAHTGVTEDVAPVAAPKVTKKETVVVKKDLSANPEMQRFAIQNKFGDKADQILEQAANNPEIAALVESTTSGFMSDLNIDPELDVEEALKKADIASQFNRGAFKTRKATPVGRSLFALNRILGKLGVGYTTTPQASAFEPVVRPDPIASVVDADGNYTLDTNPPLPPRQTGRYDVTAATPQGAITLATPILRGQQGALTGWHELGEKAVTETRNIVGRLSAISGLSNDDVLLSARKISDELRQTMTDDSHEHLVDMVSDYLYDKAEFAKKDPVMFAALEKFINDPKNGNTGLSNVAEAVEEEDAIPDSQKLDELAAMIAKEGAAANAALAERNTDKRTFLEKVKDNLKAAEIQLLNSAANLQAAARRLEKVPGYKGAANTLNKYFEVFKNRTQLATVVQTTIKNAYDRLAATGLTLDQVNDYLGNNRILNEKSFWEQQIAKENLTGQQFYDILTKSETLANLITQDPYLSDMVDSLLSADQNVMDADVLTTVLNELSSKAFAETSSADVMADLNAVQSPSLRSSLTAAFDPTITIGTKKPTEILGQTARGNIQNTANVNRDVARAALDNLYGKISPEQRAALEKFSTDVIAPLTRLAINELRDAGAIEQSTMDFYLGNADNYVTFQLASALQNDPFVDSAVRKQEGMEGVRAGPLQSTMLKVSAIRSRAATQKFTNEIADTYYNLDNSNGETIRPLFATTARGPGKNAWVNRNKNNFKDVEEISLPDMIAQKKALESDAINNNQKKSYIISAEDGDYVLHELDDSTVDAVLHPKTFATQNEFLQTLNSLQTWKRAILTSNNPAFAVRSVVRASTNLFRNRQAQNSAKQPTWTDLGKDILAAPLVGIPLNKRDRQVMWHAYKRAQEYTANSGNPNRTLDTIDQFFNNSTTVNDLMNNPYAIDILVRQGYLPASIGEDLSSGETTATAGPTPTGIFSSANKGELDGFIKGVQGQQNILQRAYNYTADKPGKAAKLATGVNAAVQKFLQGTRDLNNSLELGEKYMGIIAYMQDGIPLEEAVVKANMNFGNPDAKGGGAAKAAVSPFILYATSTLNSLRVLGSSVAGARNPLQDQRAVRAIGMGARNALVLSALPAAMYAVSRATGGDDEEAKKTADVIDRLINNIPTTDRRSGMAIPIGFRDPRTREYHLPFAAGADAIDVVDPSWTTVYLQMPYDPITGVFQSFVSAAGDVLDSKVGTAAVAGNFINNSLGSALPNAGPLINSAVFASQAARGVNPSNLFTGNNVVSDDDFAQGGAQLGLQYMQYLANEFIPLIPGPRGSSFDKTKIFEPTGFGILDSLPALLKFGVVKESNFGQIQQNRKELNLIDNFQQQVQSDIPQEAKDYINRTNELQREASRLSKIYKDQMLANGEAPSNAQKRAADLLPVPLQKELLTAQHWRREFYDRLKEKAEIALRGEDSSAYNQFIKDIGTSVPGQES
jgi:hypothetical protein